MNTTKYISALIILLTVTGLFAQNNNELKLTKLIKQSKQLILVTSKDWDEPTASMSYFERKNEKLVAVAENVNVFIGNNGLGWGNGLVVFDISSGPFKKEGDKKAPAGIFSLPYVFGLQPHDSVKWLKYSYKQFSNLNECVDDTSSEFYNKILQVNENKKNWKSSENMDDPDYKYGIVIGHNSDPVQIGCGSCIFFHLTGPKPKPTAGCTSMNEETFLKLLQWLDEKKKPILIQLPESEFQKIKHIVF